MLYFFSREHQKLTSRSWFLTYAVNQGVSGEIVETACTLIENHLSRQRILDAVKLVGILKELNRNPDSKQAKVWIRLTGWKLQGTDGVRGIVTSDRVGSWEALRLFIDENILTREFCALYAAAWSRMLKNMTSNPETSEEGVPTVLRVVIGEDGRDFYGNTGLKQSLIQSFVQSGISVTDLGIVPTPALAAYSLTHNLPGVMLTASHNPAEYNGIKLFQNGRKLYPEGFSGEYVLSWYVLSLATGKEPLQNVTLGVGSVNNVSQKETDKQVFALLRNSIDVKALESLSSISILLDTANGAYTYTALRFFSKYGVTITPIGCNPGEGRINANCGVGILENLGNVLIEDETHPEIIQALFAAGRSSNSRKFFGIALDGDGDRGFLLEYKSNEDRVYLYNGDSIGYMVASRILKTVPAERKPGFLFVSTVESDAALLPAVRNDLQVQTATTCVGDRWLVSETSSQTQILIGCERSGHVIIPTVLENNGTTLSHKVLTTGNGLAAALSALSYILQYSESGETTGMLTYVQGYRAQTTIRNCDMEGFFRGSALWSKVVETACRVITLKCCETEFTHEPDMLYFDLLDSRDNPIGRWYMRKSGTEPKISFCISVLAPFSDRSSVWMTKLKQEIAPMLMQFT